MSGLYYSHNYIKILLSILCIISAICQYFWHDKYSAIIGWCVASAFLWFS